MRELGITAADLSDRAVVSFGTVRHFGLFAHDQETLERLSVALDWRPDRLPEIWEGKRNCCAADEETA
jgi:hypothetical protein